MKRIFVTLLVCGAATGVLDTPAATAPKPSVVPIKWEFDFHAKAPRSLEVTLPGEKAPRTFWYMRYTVTNRNRNPKTAKPMEIEFIPRIVLYTDTGETIQAGEHRNVYDAVHKVEGDPLLIPPVSVSGKLLFGMDNAKRSVAIWRDFDSNSGAFDVFVGGLSGETAVVILSKPITVEEVNPLTGKKERVKKSKIVLHKTLQLSYSIPGEVGARLRTPPKLKKKTWVMR